MRVRILLITLAAASLLTACGSAKDANKSNFTKAIDTHFAKHCIVINPGNRMGNSSDAYPATIAVTMPSQFLSADRAKQQNDMMTGTYEALVKAGLLTVSDGHAKPTMSWTISGSTTQQVPAKVYALTAAGKQALADQKGMKGTGFCAGHDQVDDIVRFTPPSSAMGATMSTVIYTFSPTDVPTWAKSNAVVKAFPDLAQQLTRQQKGHIDLVLANDGWIVDSDFNQ